MDKLKKILNIICIFLLIILCIYFVNKLNAEYEDNVISRMINGLMIVVNPALIALVIAYLVAPAVNFFNKKLKINKSQSIAITIVLSLSIIVAIMIFLTAFIVKQSQILYETIVNSNLIENSKIWFESKGLENIYEKIYEIVSNIKFEEHISSVGSIIGVITNTVTIIILVPIFLWHFLQSKDKIFKGILSVFPDKMQPHVRHVGILSDKTIIAYFKSKLISMLFLFIAFLILFFGVGIPFHYALLFAFLIAIFDLVPYLGPFLGNAIPIIYIFSTGGTNVLHLEQFHVNPILATIILLSVNALFQTVQNNIIIPKLAGKEMEIDPVLILVSMLFFGYLLGVWGIILSIPLCGILLIVFKYIKGLEEPELTDDIKVEEEV